VSHLLLMMFHAVLVGAFFAFLTRDEQRERWQLFFMVSGGMLFGALALAWLMFPYPVQGTL